MKFKLDHINLTVSNIEETIEWYRKIFDMELLERGKAGIANKRWAIVGRNDSMICMTEYNGRESATDLEQDSFHQMQHFGFRVPDQKAWEEKIEKYHLKLYYGGVNHYEHSKSWYVRDPNGHSIEVSYTPEPQLQFS